MSTLPAQVIAHEMDRRRSVLDAELNELMERLQLAQRRLRDENNAREFDANLSRRLGEVLQYAAEYRTLQSALAWTTEANDQ